MSYYNNMITLVDAEIYRRDQIRKQWTGIMDKETEATLIAETLNLESIKKYILLRQPSKPNIIDGNEYCPVCGAHLDDNFARFCTVCSKQVVK